MTRSLTLSYVRLFSSSSYYLSCHPLSPSKLACLRFLHDYLLVPPRGFDWLRCDFLRRVWIDEGEWAALLHQLADAIAQHSAQLRAQQDQENEAAKSEEAAADSFAVVAPVPLAAVSSPLLTRYFEMVDLLLDLLLNAGRIYHGVVLDYNLVQDQLAPFFGHFASASASASVPTPVIPGPFWTLPLSLQHKSLQLLYYFDSLSPLSLQLLLECVRANLADGAASLSLASRLLVVDMVEDKYEQAQSQRAAPWPLQSYIAFILGMVRSDLSAAASASASSLPPAPDAIDPARVSLLLPTACRMLRGIGASEIDAAMNGQIVTVGKASSRQSRAHAAAAATAVEPALLPLPSSPAVLLELLAPMLAHSLQASLPASALADAQAESASSPSPAVPPAVPASASNEPARLDFLSALLLVESLLSHAGDDAALPPALFALMPAALYYLLSSTLSAALVESGAVRAPAGWLTAPPTSFLVAGGTSGGSGGGHGGQLWLLSLRLLHQLSASVPSSSSGCLSRLLRLMHAKLRSGASISSGRDSAHQVVVVLAALTKSDRQRTRNARRSALQRLSAPPAGPLLGD